MSGVRGDAEAISEAKAMVETMGGMGIWAQLKSVHFVHEWWPYCRVDSYVENEILDLTGSRSWAVYENGSTMYEMISLKGSNQPLDPKLFRPPPEYRKQN